MLVFWAIAAAVFLIIEGITVAMCAIWFTAGALVSLIAASLNAPLWLQIVLFFLVSGVCFWQIYPRARNAIHRRRQSTNADMVLGQTCSVTERIDNIQGTGTVLAGGKTWTARTADGCVIEAGSLVLVEQIQGVKLIVKPIQEEIKS